MTGQEGICFGLLGGVCSLPCGSLWFLAGEGREMGSSGDQHGRKLKEGSFL